MGKFYRMLDDPSISGRWHLGESGDRAGRAIDSRRFSEGRRLDLGEPLLVEIQYPGSPLDITLAAFDMPVLSPRATKLFEELCGESIQLFMSKVEGQLGTYSVMNVIELVDCIDERASLIERWQEEHGRQDKVGQFRTVAGLRIDPDRAGAREIFRLAGWSIALILSSNLKKSIENLGLSGVKFTPV